MSMKLKPNKLLLSKSFLVIFLVSSVVFFLATNSVLLKPKWDFVQPLIIAVFLAVSLMFYVFTLTGLDYTVEKKYLEVRRLRKHMFYYYSEIVYIEEEKSRKKKTITFVTNKGHVRYLPYDKEGILLDHLLANCHSLLSKEMLKVKYPSVRL